MLKIVITTKVPRIVRMMLEPMDDPHAPAHGEPEHGQHDDDRFGQVTKTRAPKHRQGPTANAPAQLRCQS